jgi:peptide-methionine (S)-S-oxide reductase
MKRTLLLAAILIPVSLMAANFPDPPAEQPTPAGAKKATAVLAGGCYWGMQGVFEHVKGVTETTVGFSGGERKTAIYDVVENGNTGHAESIQITYDPSVITYGQLLKIYFSVAHDPTTLNRQHNDVGTQYRSEIFWADDNQKNVAAQYIKILDGAHVYKHPVVTKLEQMKGFYRAEQDHQHYLDQVQACGNRQTGQCGDLNSGYIQAFDIPLLNDLQKKYPDLYVKAIH